MLYIAKYWIRYSNSISTLFKKVLKYDNQQQFLTYYWCFKKEPALSSLKIYKCKSVSEIFDNTSVETNTLFYYIIAQQQFIQRSCRNDGYQQKHID